MRQIFEEVLTAKFEEVGLFRTSCYRCEEADVFPRKVIRSWTAGQAAREVERLQSVTSQVTTGSKRTPSMDSVVPYPVEVPPTPQRPRSCFNEELSSSEDDKGPRNQAVRELRVWQCGGSGRASLTVGGDDALVPHTVRHGAEVDSIPSSAIGDDPVSVFASESRFPPMNSETRHGGFKAWSDSKQRSTKSLTASFSTESEYLAGDHKAMGGHMTTKLMRQRFQKRAMTKSLPARFENAPYFQLLCATIILHPRFDWVVSIVILANAATMGVSAELIATTSLTSDPTTIVVLEKIFCVLFSIELALRLVAHRCLFFYGTGWTWNIFDFCVVSFQVIEEIMSALAMGTVGWTGVLRLLRLVRVVRLARILRLIRELRVLVSSISNSMRSLVWTVLLMFLIIYSVSLCITQLVTDYRLALTPELRSDPGRAARIDDLERYFGSLLRCMLSLFEAITGGMDWDTLVVPLMEEVSPALGAVLVIYVAIAVLAIMNVVTGVFVDSVLASAKADKEQYLLNNAREIFKTVDEEMDWAAFQGKMETPQMLEFFRGIDVDPSEAQGIFSLIDLDESGSINADEFLNGCVKLQGPSKALETAVLLQEVRSLRRHIASMEK